MMNVVTTRRMGSPPREEVVRTALAFHHAAACEACSPYCSTTTMMGDPVQETWSFQCTS